MEMQHYNREQRRKLKRRLKKNGISVEDAIDLFTRRLQDMGADALPEGTKVRLNYDAITGQPNYAKRQEVYRNFVEENKDRVFTVAYDEKHQSGKLVLLAEDTSEQHWLWHCGDLIVVKTEEEIDSELETANSETEANQDG